MKKPYTFFISIAACCIIIVAAFMYYISTSGKPRITLHVGNNWATGSILFHPTENIIGVASDNAIALWNIDTRQQNIVFAKDGGNDRGHDSFAWSPDGIQIVTDTPSMTWSIYNTSDGSLIKSFPNTEPDYILSLSWSTTNLIAVAYPNNRADVWDIRNEEVLYHLQDTAFDIRGTPSSMNVITFSPDGQILAGGGSDGHIRLWSMDDGHLMIDIPAHASKINDLAFSHDGILLASASDEYDVALWSIPSGARVRNFRGHQDVVNSVAFSPDDTQLVTGSGRPYESTGEAIDGSVRVWSIEKGSLITILGTDSSGVDYVTYSPDGRMIAANGKGSIINLWDVPK
jgi:WD40 repeat protein